VEAAGNKPKLIDEYVGRQASGHSEVSVAHMRSPGGWVEPGQTPAFDEFTVVLSGRLRLTGARLGRDIAARLVSALDRSVGDLGASYVSRGRVIVSRLIAARLVSALDRSVGDLGASYVSRGRVIGLCSTAAAGAGLDFLGNRERRRRRAYDQRGDREHHQTTAKGRCVHNLLLRSRKSDCPYG